MPSSTPEAKKKKTSFRRLDQEEEDTKNYKNYKNYIIGLNQ
jgi:hypothetical protein